jgi:hypothetical protein
LAQRRSWSVLPLPFTSICFVEVRVGAEQPALPIVGLPVPKPARLGLLVPKDDVIDAIRVVGDLVVRLPDLGVILCASSCC